VTEETLQLSLAVGEPRLTLVAKHWPELVLTVTLAGHVIDGAWLSWTVTVKLQVAVLPDPSVTLNVFVVTPTGNAAPLGSPAVCVSIGPVQLSE
jgi:hypothetical protein